MDKHRLLGDVLHILGFRKDSSDVFFLRLFWSHTYVLNLFYIHIHSNQSVFKEARRKQTKERVNAICVVSYLSKTQLNGNRIKLTNNY